MKRSLFSYKIVLLFAILWMISLLYNNPEVHASEIQEATLQQVRVTEIIDLVSLKAEDGRVLPLYGVTDEYYETYQKKFKEASDHTLPEGGELNISASYFKGESIEHLVARGIKLYQDLLIGKTVYIEEASTNSYILYLDKHKNQSLNQLAVKAGVVTVSKDNQQMPDLLLQQEDARMLKAGLWDIVIYVQFPGSWSSSNTMNYTLFFIGLNFLFSLIVYIFYTRNRSVLGVIALYSALILNTLPATQIYTANSIHAYFWVPPVVFLSFVLICIIEFVIFIFSKVKKNLLYVALEIFLFMTLVIIGFAILYQGISNSSEQRSEISYSLPDFEYYSNLHKEEPVGDYIMLPDNEYDTSTLVEVNNSTIENKHYHLSLMNALYFSATTFFTVGFGDFSPKGFLKLLSMSEMAIGNLSQIILFSIVISKVTMPAPSTVSSNEIVTQKNDPPPTRASRIKQNQKTKKSNKFGNLLYIIMIIENIYFVLQYITMDFL